MVRRVDSRLFHLHREHLREELMNQKADIYAQSLRVAGKGELAGGRTNGQRVVAACNAGNVTCECLQRSAVHGWWVGHHQCQIKILQLALGDLRAGHGAE